MPPARERFLQEARQALPALAKSAQEQLQRRISESANAREGQDRRDAFSAFQQRRQGWLEATVQGWQRSLQAAPDTSGRMPTATTFELMGMDVMENRILASRLATVLLDKVFSEFEDLRIRIEYVERRDLPQKDVLRPEVLVQALVDGWVDAGLPRADFQAVIEPSQHVLAERMLLGYRAANALLVAQNILPTIQPQHRMRRSAAADGSTTTRAQPLARPSVPPETPSGATRLRDDSSRSGLPSGDRPVPPNGSGDEGRSSAAATPLARARIRAQGVLGALKRVLVGQVSDFERTAHRQTSPALAEALRPQPQAQHASVGEASDEESFDTLIEDYSPAGVARVAGALRAQTVDLKKKATTDSEKATIEIVALMFQSILAEDRIPTSIRVWFARLQLPVLRVALAEPDFFNSSNHPARQLIDRIGSCVMGFDTAAINGTAFEAEIKRIVQVIEQYPETGGRVFHLVHEEFKKFLSTYLTAQDSTQRVVSVAQQMEQKETLAIQYTIEMRNMLKDMPVPDAIRDFMFKTWAEALAVATVRHGPQHSDTIALKQVAPELVWAAGAKPNRKDRARVIQELPHLLQRLRWGMNLLGLAADVQEAQLKVVSDTLAAAFLSKAEPIAAVRLEAMAERLAHLEDFVTDEGLGDLPIDADNLELMLGINASALTLIAAGGSQPSDAMIAWALELQPGHWFSLEYGGVTHTVQFVWRSERKQLFLFASRSGGSYLLQRRRLAAFLQAGLLLPQEEEALSVRATRTAIQKLDADPERLLA